MHCFELVTQIIDCIHNSLQMACYTCMQLSSYVESEIIPKKPCPAFHDLQYAASERKLGRSLRTRLLIQ